MDGMDDNGYPWLLLVKLTTAPLVGYDMEFEVCILSVHFSRSMSRW